MNRFITSDDLTRLLEKTSKLAKLAESARSMACDLTTDKGEIKDVHDDIKRCRMRLRRRNTTKNRRRKVERKLQFYDEWLYDARRELKDKNSGFSDAISQIEAALRELSETGETLAKVHRFEHGS